MYKQIILLGILFFLTSLVYAKIWYVDGTEEPGGSGEDWNNAFSSIHEAISNVEVEPWVVCMMYDQIWVKEGTYDLHDEIVVDKIVNIYGGFKGDEESISQRNWKEHPTIINAPENNRCFRIEVNCVIDGFIVQNGNVTGNGGGFFIESYPLYCEAFKKYFSPEIVNCTIRNNHAITGGGVYDIGSDVQLNNCILYGNSAAHQGGAVSHLYSSPDFEKCIFYDNNALESSGGAIHGFQRSNKTYGLPTIINCLFYDNHAVSGCGGAINYSHVNPDIINCTFSNNSARIGGAFYGGSGCESPGIYNSIFWEDSPDEIFVTMTLPHLEVNNSCIQGGWAGPGANNTDEYPQFVFGDYYLGPGSPCIDTGTARPTVQQDLDGLNRPIDGNGNGTFEWDMGCYEFNNPELVVPDLMIVDIMAELVGDMVYVEVIVENQGYNDAYDFYIDWYSHLDSPPLPFMVGDMTEFVPTLAPGDIYVMTGFFVYPSAGLYQMYAQVDREKTVNELYEDNNSFGPVPISAENPIPWP